MSVTAITGILAAISAGVQLSSESSASIANDVTILRTAFGGKNKQRLIDSLKANSLNAAGDLGSQLADMKSELESAGALVVSLVDGYKSDVAEDGSITVKEMETLMLLQNLSNHVRNGWTRVRAIERVQQELAAASSVPAQG